MFIWKSYIIDTKNEQKLKVVQFTNTVSIYAWCKAALKLKLSFPSLTILSSRFYYVRCHKSDYGCFLGGGKPLQFCGRN